MTASFKTTMLLLRLLRQDLSRKSCCLVQLIKARGMPPMDLLLPVLLLAGLGLLLVLILKCLQFPWDPVVALIRP